MSGENGKVDDLEWPTFGETEQFQVSYSPEPKDDVFTEFKPSSDKHNIRNKKRLQRSKKKQSIRRLWRVSESDIDRQHQSCLHDRKRCVVISVLVACIVIIVAIAIGLGVYFGVVRKSKADDPKHDFVVDEITFAPYSTSTSTSVTTTQMPVTPSTATTTTKATTKIPSTQTTTPTSTSTTTTITTTTSTTTTTTTPLPTKPPVIPYTGSDAEIALVRQRLNRCRLQMAVFEKCQSYRDMVTCAYLESVRQGVLVPVVELDTVAERHLTQILPWDSFRDPLVCRENGALRLSNVSALPTTLDGLCSSADAVKMYGRFNCSIIHYPLQMETMTKEEQCRVQWGVVGCVASVLKCAVDEISHVMAEYQTNISDSMGLAGVNASWCKDVFEALVTTSLCEATLYQNMFTISTQCGQVIQQPALVANATGNSCILFDTFFECSYNTIPSGVRFKECERKKETLRKVMWKVAALAANVNNLPKLVNAQTCLDRPPVHRDVCSASEQLIAIVDTKCYVQFNYLTDKTVCLYLSRYVFACGTTYMNTLGLSCTAKHIHDALVAQSGVIDKIFTIDVQKYNENSSCIDAGNI
ncbi:uncharacterized protein LOC127857945 [Dreissena polymorpha]|uniref:Uncharacterized protein n=1 Tax=Dreissena polymorpha TaxID=45954 RepID=A0A9D4BUL5_DREPO|nr:uncharacterized protein LOC127857945 [Dreissena polymorpha]XP_052250682.1 uncharacterized protein LOC127857945 [Dreissena polymorpha]KAH3706563.1 hypothetical protein DPMN_065950 [Dreissena polymorpha]